MVATNPIRTPGERELIERLLEEAEAFGGSRFDDDDGNVLAALFRQAATALQSRIEEVAMLREAATIVITTAERPGSRAEYGIGPNGKEIWHDYQEVRQAALDRLAAALATPTQPGDQ